jgi:predicted PurR-regulated permease PerM
MTTPLSESSTLSELGPPTQAGEADGKVKLPMRYNTPAPTVIQENSDWDASTKRIVLVILLGAVLVILWVSRPVIPMLVVAAIFAYLLSPIVDLSERIRIPRAVSTIVLYLLLMVALLLTPILLAPVLLAQLASLNFDVPTTAFNLLNWLRATIANLPDRIELFGFDLPMEGITDQIEVGIRDFVFIPTLAEILSYIQQLISTATNLVSSTAAIGVSVVGGIVQLFFTGVLIFFLSIYLTKDAPRIKSYVEGLFPSSYQSELIHLLQRMGHIWQAFLRGQIILCVVVGVATWLALEVAGMPGALILGLVAGSLEIIPNLGPVLAMIPAVIIALIQGSTVLSEYGISNFGFALITVAIYFIIQQLENYILVPRIIGNSVSLHPIVVICGVVIGFNLAGILGAFFAAPVIASLRVLGSYIHAKLLGYPPFLDQDVPSRWRSFSTFKYRRTVTGDELAHNRGNLDGATQDDPTQVGPTQDDEAAAADSERAEKEPAQQRAMQDAPTT